MKTNEWSLLKLQFDALVHNESVAANKLENIFDAEFRRRFAELMNRVAERQSKTGTPPSSPAFYKAISRRFEI